MPSRSSRQPCPAYSSAPTRTRPPLGRRPGSGVGRSSWRPCTRSLRQASLWRATTRALGGAQRPRRPLRCSRASRIRPPQPLPQLLRKMTRRGLQRPRQRLPEGQAENLAPRLQRRLLQLLRLPAPAATPSMQPPRQCTVASRSPRRTSATSWPPCPSFRSRAACSPCLQGARISEVPHKWRLQLPPL